MGFFRPSPLCMSCSAVIAAKGLRATGSAQLRSSIHTQPTSHKPTSILLSVTQTGSARQALPSADPRSALGLMLGNIRKGLRASTHRCDLQIVIQRNPQDLPAVEWRSHTSRIANSTANDTFKDSHMLILYCRCKTSQQPVGSSSTCTWCTSSISSANS